MAGQELTRDELTAQSSVGCDPVIANLIVLHDVG